MNIPLGQLRKSHPEPLHSLTGLRFYAAMLVFISHLYIYHFCFNLTAGPVYDLLVQLGWLGVSLFFVLSGFVLYINYLSPEGEPFSIREFFIARFARIYPVFFLTTLFAVPIELLSAHDKSLPMILIANLLMLHGLSGYTNGTLNAPGWSIGAEFFFYLLFPVLAVLFVSRPGINFLKMMFWYLVYLAAMMIFFSNSYYAGDGFPFNRLAEFILGMGAGYFFAWYQTNPFLQKLATMEYSKIIGIALIFLMFALMVIQPWVLPTALKMHKLFYLYYAGPAVVIILTLAFLEKALRAPSFMVLPLVVLGGEISYSFYLLHHLVIRYVKHLFTFLFLTDVRTLSPLFSVPLVMIILGVTLLLSYKMYLYIEKPSRKLIIEVLNSKDPWQQLLNQPFVAQQLGFFRAFPQSLFKAHNP